MCPCLSLIIKLISNTRASQRRRYRYHAFLDTSVRFCASIMMKHVLCRGFGHELAIRCNSQCEGLATALSVVPVDLPANFHGWYHSSQRVPAACRPV
eukprot:6173203-Pleurochrysis_carterae.AAC.2